MTVRRGRMALMGAVVGSMLLAGQPTSALTKRECSDKRGAIVSDLADGKWTCCVPVEDPLGRPVQQCWTCTGEASGMGHCGQAYRVIPRGSGSLPEPADVRRRRE